MSGVCLTCRTILTSTYTILLNPSLSNFSLRGIGTFEAFSCTLSSYCEPSVRTSLHYYATFQVMATKKVHTLWYGRVVETKKVHVRRGRLIWFAD